MSENDSDFVSFPQYHFGVFARMREMKASCLHLCTGALHTRGKFSQNRMNSWENETVMAAAHL